MSPSISPLSYNLTVTIGSVTVRIFTSSLVRVFNTSGFGTTGGGLVFTGGMEIFVVTESLAGFLTGGLFFTVGLVITGGLFTTIGFFSGGVVIFVFYVSFFTGASLIITGVVFILPLKNGST